MEAMELVRKTAPHHPYIRLSNSSSGGAISSRGVVAPRYPLPLVVDLALESWSMKTVVDF